MTQGNRMDASLGWQEMKDELEQVKTERDALSTLCQEAATVLERTANDTLDGRNMAVRLRESPATSLARLKAQWQAEAARVTELEKDAARYRYIKKKGGQWIVAATQTGFHVDGEVLDNLIDSEMEQS